MHGHAECHHLPVFPAESDSLGRESVSLYGTEYWHVGVVGGAVYVTAYDVVLSADSWTEVVCPYNVPEKYRPGTDHVAPCVNYSAATSASALWAMRDGTIKVQNLGGAGVRAPRYGTLSYPIGL